MGTVGINFGSASSGQGFDVAATVTQILAVSQSIEAPWKTQLTTLKAQDTAFSSLGQDLSTLTTSAQALTDFFGVFSQKLGSSSNTNVLTLTGAGSSATAGSHTIDVTNLASTSSQYASPIPASDTLAGSVTIQVGSGAAQTITVGSGSNTAASLATAINRAGIGVSASVISDASGSRLSIVSGTGGSAGQLTLTNNLTDSTNSGAALVFNIGQTGTDASFKVDGIALTSPTNAVSGALAGVSFQLLAPGNQVQVEITNDTSSISTGFATLVSSYNAVVKDISTQEGSSQPLFGSPTVAALQSQLAAALVGGSGNGAIKDFSQLGLAVNNDGTLTLNTATLGSVLNTNFSDVAGFLQNTGSFGQTFVAGLGNLGTATPSSLLSLAQQQNATQESSLNKSVTDQDARIAAQKISLTTELNTANQILQSIPSQLTQQSEIYSAITGYNQNK